MSFHQFPVRFGKYIVLDRISSGGMAEVYRAKEIRESGLSPVIAIKRMLPNTSSDEAMTPMFVDEAKLASQLSHPNIAQTYELGRVDDDLYIAMELVWGRDLRSIAKAVSKSKQQFPIALACYTISKAAEALDFAHNAKAADGRPMRLVHRDVSPHNLMLSISGDVKVIDFGVAKAESKSNETQAGVIKGKFSYMAPEQVLGGNIDARTDIFALGIVLYELLTSERLYDGSSAFSIFDKVVNHAAPMVSDTGVPVPPGLNAVVAKALAKKAEDRYQNAGELADALSPFLIHERTIFGPRDAGTFLRSLFPADEEEMRERIRRYEAVREVDCIDMNEEVASPWAGGVTQVLVASQIFAASPDIAKLGTGSRPGAPIKSGSGSKKPKPSELPTAWQAAQDGASSQQTEFLNIHTSSDVKPPADLGATPPAGPALTPLAQRGSRAPAVIIGIVVTLAALAFVFRDTSSKPSVAVSDPVIAPVVAPTALVDTPPQVGTAVAPIPDPAPQDPPTQPVELGVTPTSEPGSTPIQEPSVARDPTPKPNKTPPGPKEPGGFGFVSIGTKGAQSAKVFIDGKESGFAPIYGLKLKAGKHDVKIVPIRDELPGTPITQTINVSKEHTQTNPLRVTKKFD